MARKKYRGSRPEKRDLSGDLFGRLRVLAYSHITRRSTRRKEGWKNTQTRHHWHCQCTCGTILVVEERSLLSGNTQSCGCLYRETRGANRIHGHAETAMYYRWHSIRKRCYDPNDSQYRHYGGRGITMAQEWYDSLERFIEDVGQPPFPGATLDRRDNNKGYTPENVRWVTNIEQQSNRRNNVYLTYQGTTATQAYWDREMGFKKGTIRERLARGWTLEDALTLPIGTRKPTCGSCHHVLPCSCVRQ